MATWSGKVSKKTIFGNNTANILLLYYALMINKNLFFFARSTRFEYKRVILGLGILLLSYCNMADNFLVAVKYTFIYFHCYLTFYSFIFSFYSFFYQDENLYLAKDREQIKGKVRALNKTYQLYQ